MLEELIIRTLCDTLPGEPADALFLFGQTEDNQASAFAAVHTLQRQKCLHKVLFLHTQPLSGYPGYANWKEALTAQGIAAESIEPVAPVPSDPELLHTRIEAESVILHAKEKGYTRLIVTASPFQQPRAFMAAVTAAQLHYPGLYLYSLPGKAMPWKEQVVHSQGEVQDTRAGLIAGEMERIRKYHAQGDLASVDEVVAYLNRRDSRKLG